MFRPKGMRKITDLPQEERLKPDQLRSMTECERAIHAVAEKTGKSPLDIWRANEMWRSEAASKVDWDVGCSWYCLCVSNLFMFGNLLCQLYRPDWYRSIAGAVALIVLGNVMIMIYFHKPAWIRPYGRFLRAFAGVVFSLALTFFGYDFLPARIMYDLVMGVLGIVFAACFVVLFHWLCELIWNHSEKERDECREQLSTLRSVRPLLTGGSRSAVESRSSVVSCARLRAVVDWD